MTAAPARGPEIEHVLVDPRVMRVAKSIRRPGEVLQIVSTTEVLLLPKAQS